jgi:hypothetical protein
MAVLGSMVGVPVVMRMTTIIRLFVSLLSMIVCFAVPMLLVIGHLTVPLRFVLPMLHAVMIITLLWHIRQTTMRVSSPWKYNDLHQATTSLLLPAVRSMMESTAKYAMSWHR